jgi:hypothetical protein
MLSVCFIDEKKCSYLLKCLENYHKKYNEKTQAYSETPMHDWCSHACLIGETLISTDQGLKPIKQISVGDMVKTPFGFRKVLDTYKYSVTELCKLKTSKNKELTCTRNHKIFTDKSLNYCDTLRYNQTIINEEYDGLEICQKYTGCLGGKKNLGFRDIFLLTNAKIESSLMEGHINGVDFIIADNLDGGINIQKFEYVVTCVVVNCQEKPVDVYDITVDVDHCYFANGILVSNSDSIRYMANARIQFGRGLGSLSKSKLDEIKSQAGFAPKRNNVPGPFNDNNNTTPYSNRR